MKLTLHREIGTANDCTIGALLVAGLALHTMERPWVPSPECKSGQKGVSRVMFGTYRLEKHSSELHPKTWALVNPDLDVLHWPDPAHPNARTAVLIHPANWASELRGCIAPGKALARANGQWMVQRSREAMADLLSTVPWTDEHTLEIV